MKKSLRTRLREAEQRIRDLQNQRESVEFPLRKRIAELEKETADARLTLEQMSRELHAVAVMTSAITARCSKLTPAYDLPLATAESFGGRARDA